MTPPPLNWLNWSLFPSSLCFYLEQVLALVWSQPSKNSGPGPSAPTLTHPPWKYQLYHFQDKFRLFQFSAMSGWWEKPSGSKISQVSSFLEVLPLFTVLIVSLPVDAKSFLLLFHHLRSSLFIQFWKEKNKGLFAVTFHISLTNSSGTIEPISSQNTNGESEYMLSDIFEIL